MSAVYVGQGVKLHSVKGSARNGNAGKSTQPARTAGASGRTGPKPPAVQYDLGSPIMGWGEFFGIIFVGCTVAFFAAHVALAVAEGRGPWAALRGWL